MQFIAIYLIFNLDTGKRVGRFVECLDHDKTPINDSELPKKLLLPTRLPQEWLPAGLRTAKYRPVVAWTDQSLFAPEIDGLPEGLSG